MKIKTYEDPNPNASTIVSYKGSSESDSAMFYCPYIPLQIHGTIPAKTFGWQKLLNELSHRHILIIAYASADPMELAKNRIMEAIGEMQEAYPGNYTLVEEENTSTNHYEYKMVFDTPEDESLFVMKYSTK